MTVSENWFTFQLNDVLVGEVWLVAAGSGTGGMTHEAGNATPLSPFVRMYRVDSQAGAGGKWRVTSPESAREYSATAYFLGRELYNKLKVPIGLIEVPYGGSSAQAWIGSKALAANPDLRFLLDNGGAH
jgi:sialate O-acetylesterase